MHSNKFSVCVFCGSRIGSNASFANAAREFGIEIARMGWRLVYGAGDVGLMGEVATATQCEGGSTFGVIPRQLVELEVAKHDLDSLVITDNMHVRKSVMFANSDAFIVMPGGPGTHDEFFEILTWRQLGFHDKPIGLLNVANYWNGLLGSLGNAVDCGFADPELLESFEVLNTVAESILWLHDSFESGPQSARDGSAGNLGRLCPPSDTR